MTFNSVSAASTGRNRRHWIDCRSFSVSALRWNICTATVCASSFVDRFTYCSCSRPVHSVTQCLVHFTLCVVNKPWHMLKSPNILDVIWRGRAALGSKTPQFLAGLPWGRNFYPHTYPISTENPVGIPQDPHTHRTPKSYIPVPAPCLFTTRGLF